MIWCGKLPVTRHCGGAGHRSWPNGEIYGQSLKLNMSLQSDTYGLTEMKAL